jgi:hypothetical protein
VPLQLQFCRFYLQSPCQPQKLAVGSKDPAPLAIRAVVAPPLLRVRALSTRNAILNAERGPFLVVGFEILGPHGAGRRRVVEAARGKTREFDIDSY